MFDVIECFEGVSTRKQSRLIVFQTPDIAVAREEAERLWQGSCDGVAEPGGSRLARGSESVFVVVDRSTARELYRVPAA